MHDHINEPSKQNPRRSEQTSAKTYEDELAILCDAIARFEPEQQAACVTNPPDGTWTKSQVESVLEKALGYIHHLQNQEKALEEESEALSAKLTF